MIQELWPLFKLCKNKHLQFVISGDCQPGTFRDTDNECYDCDKGYYQDKKWQTECIRCAEGSNGIFMTTDGQGADDASDCFCKLSTAIFGFIAILVWVAILDLFLVV